MLSRYFIQFDDTISLFDFVVSTHIHKRKLNDFFGILEGRIEFQFGILHFLEVVKIDNNQLIKKKYKYHFIRDSDTMIFRYDNAPHHQSVLTFPHHKHIGSKIVESLEPNIIQILHEIQSYQV